MKKIITLFCRNYEGDRLVRDEIVSGAEWVVAGEGVATRKLDGTACLVQAGRLYKRYDAKAGRKPPPDFVPAQAAPDEVTGHWPGWVPVGNGPEDRWHREAFARVSSWRDGTYELIGPHVQGNPERAPTDVLVRHGIEELPDAPRDFAGLKRYLAEHDIEGIVWWRRPGDAESDMVKIKARDFGLKRS